MKELATVPSKTEEVDMLISQAERYHSTDPIRSLNYAEEALQKSKSLEYTMGSAKAHGILAGLYTLHFKDEDKADFHFNLYQKLVSEVSRQEEKGVLMYRSAIKLYQDDKYGEAIRYFADAHDIFMELKLYDRLAKVHFTSGLMFRRLDMFTEAEVHFREAFKIFDNIQDETLKLRLMRTSARNYINMEENGKARDMLNRSIEHALSIDSVDLDLAGLYNLLGNSLVRLGEYESARENFNQGLKEAIDKGDKKSEGWIYLNMGFLHNDLERYDSAIYYFDKALETLMPTASSFYLTLTYQSYSNTMLKLKRYKSVEELSEKGLMLTGNKDPVKRKNLLENVIKAEMILQKHREAFDHQQQLDLLNAADERERYIEELENAYLEVSDRLTLGDVFSKT
ncbi:MAG: hypothetical protein WBB45_16690 [Cyclobacteriaceae bacterium]